MEKESKTTKKATTKATATKKHQPTLLEAVETIVTKARDSQLRAGFMSQCKDEIQLIADSYGITPQQAILFCVTLECGPYHVRHHELPRFLNLSNVKSLSFGPDINSMIKMRILRYCDRDKDNFSVTEPVLNALRENKAQIRPTTLVEDSSGLFEVMDIWFDWLNENSISPEELIGATK